MAVNRKYSLIFKWFTVILVTLFSFHFFGLKITAVDMKSFAATRFSDQPCRFKGTDWETIDFEQLTPKQVLEYVTWANRTSCQLIHDFGGNMHRNPSGLDGQKAVCLEPVQLAPPVNNCLVYSFGISNEWSFDEAMEKYGCEVYAFDPSMQVGDHDHTPAIHFFKLGLSNQKSTNAKGWKLETLSSIYDLLKPRHGDRPIDYLKMDIEHSEWGVIPQMIQSGMLNKIRQLSMEIHLSPGESSKQMRDRVGIIRSLEKNGMVRFDSKLNPWTRTSFKSLEGARYPFAYEIVWYNNKFL